MDVLVYSLLFIFLQDAGLSHSEFDKTDVVRSNTLDETSKEIAGRERFKTDDIFQRMCLNNTRQSKETAYEVTQLKSKLKINDTIFPYIKYGREEMVDNSTRTVSYKSNAREVVFPSTYTNTQWEEFPEEMQMLKNVNNSAVVKKSGRKRQSGLEINKTTKETFDKLKTEVVAEVRQISVNETLEVWCDEGWHYFQNRCYWFSGPSDKRKWQDSTNHCRENSGSHILELNSDEELKFVLSKITKSPDSVWVGASYIVKEKMFQWTHSKAPIQWEYWSTGALSGVTEQESCVYLTKWEPVKTLNSAYCEIKQRFVCETIANFRSESFAQTIKR